MTGWTDTYGDEVHRVLDLNVSGSPLRSATEGGRGERGNCGEWCETAGREHTAGVKGRVSRMKGGGYEGSRVWNRKPDSNNQSIVKQT